MTVPSLDAVLEAYAQTMSPLEISPSLLSDQEVLGILKARDAIAETSTVLTKLTFEQQKKLVALDKVLKQKAWQLSKALDFASWRTSLEPPKSAWWWYLDTEAKHPRWQKLDWLWRGLSVAGWTVNLGLLIDLVPRFLMTGTGFGGAAAIAFPSILTLLQAKSELTETGKEGFEQLLVRLGIPKYFHREAQFSATLLLFIVLLGFRLGLPNFSDLARQEGFENYQAGQIAEAEAYYLQALSLDPDNIKAHYSLAVVYEDLQQFAQARRQYLLAVKGSYLKAYNNLGRLHILEKKPDLAVPLLVEGLSKLEELSQGEEASNLSIKYNMMKNLGWAFFEQEGRQKKAEKFLRIAIALTRSTEGIEKINNRASAHCLLAQVYEEQNKKPEALTQWKECSQWGSIFNPDEGLWLSLAQQKLEEE